MLKDDLEKYRNSVRGMILGIAQTQRIAGGLWEFMKILKEKNIITDSDIQRIRDASDTEEYFLYKEYDKIEKAQREEHKDER